MAHHDHAPPLTEKIVSLDSGDETSVVGEMGLCSVSILEIIERFSSGDIDELVCFDGTVECPDDMSRSDFDSFEYYDSLLDLTETESSTRFSFGMKNWVEKVIPAAIGKPKTIVELIGYYLRAKFDDLQIYHERRAVGEAASVVFEETCLIFARGNIEE